MNLPVRRLRFCLLGVALSNLPCTAIFSQCGTNPTFGATVIATSGSIVNSYYPGTGSPAVGGFNITVGTIDGRGSATTITAGDLVIIMQMQGADINSTNTDSYGDGVAGAPASGYLTSNLFAGQYEYNTVASVAGSTITFSYGLANNYYTQAFTASLPIRTYQVIRVPRYYDLSISLASSITCPAWNGSTGGVVVLDATNTLNFLAASASVTVAGKGFRGGGGRQLTGVTAGNTNGTTGITATDYRFNSSATNPANLTGGSKGEGIAGSPINIPNTATLTTTTGTLEGYINGSVGRGAPANAGGGGTDGDPSQNQFNTGGGGGGNAGAGGNGGSGWDNTGGNPNVYPNGGGGGTSFTQAALAKIIMGGGGGAGCANNSTTANQYYSSGASGGGIIIMRAKSYSGTGSVIADGAAATDITITSQTDAAGGGGAGGTIVLVTTQTGTTGLAGVIVSARGGKGGNMTTYWSHGPGGGGGGGLVYTNNATFTTAPAVSGGANGLTHTCCSTTNPLTDVYGSAPGGNGSLVTLPSFPVFYNSNNALSPCGALPIILRDFNAVALDETSVRLSWTVEQATDFKQFEVEYSTNGIQFNNIGIVRFESGQMTYQLTQQPVTSALNYYRLKMMDIDGKFTNSPVLLVNIKNSTPNVMSFYPNPAMHNVTLRLNVAVPQTENLVLIDNSGRTIVSKQLSLAKGQNFINVPEVEKLPVGMYHLRISIDGTSYTGKLMKE